MSDSPTKPTRTLEIAHVLFADIVGYSKLPMDEQEQLLMQLQDAVRQTSEFVRAEAADELIRLPTGDGMALAFFRDAEAPVRCALELSRILQDYPSVQLRMGIHSGPVYRVADINANRNVAGGGINIAQRVMDCGDAGHILVSREVAEVIGQLSGWRPMLHELGEAEVKHGVRIHIYNLYNDKAGNSAEPKKLAASKAVAAAPELKPAQEPARPRWMAATGAAMLVIGLAVGGWLLFSRRVHALTDKDTIVIADFTNTTGDTVFDGTLRQGLSVQLEQSPFLSIISDQRIQQTLQMMGQKPDAKLTPELARELCQRAGSTAGLDGSIAQIGTQYDLILRAVNCSNGESLTSTETQARDESHVLDALGKAASEIREKLGESLRTVEKFDTPLEQATTPSLEALKALTLAMRAQSNSDEGGAIALYKRAIELDPNFATAYKYLGRCYSVANDSDLADQNEKRAYELRNRVNEREKLSIEADYQLVVIRNLERAAEAFELLSAAYPRDVGSVEMLGNLYTHMGQHDKAIVQLRRALAIDPQDGEIYSELASAYQFMNREDDARSTINVARRQYNLASPSLHYWEYMLDFVQGNVDGMTTEVDWSVGKPGSDAIFLDLQARTAAYSGKLRKAREFAGRLIPLMTEGNLNSETAATEASEALREALYGNSEEARKGADALALFSNRDVLPTAALALAFAGDTAHALSFAVDLQKRFPEDTLLNSFSVPAIRAVTEISQQNPKKAIETLRQTVPLELGANYEFSLYPVYVRAQAYLAARQGREAADEFQKILDRRGIVLNEPIGALAHLGLARAYVLQGDTAKARIAYQDFLALWKDADPDIPILIAAKAEHAKLK